MAPPTGARTITSFTTLIRAYWLVIESDDASKTITIALFQDYTNFGGPLIATKNVSRTGERSQTFTYKSVSYEPLPDSLFELPEAVKRVMK